MFIQTTIEDCFRERLREVGKEFSDPYLVMSVQKTGLECIVKNVIHHSYFLQALRRLTQDFSDQEGLMRVFEKLYYDFDTSEDAFTALAYVAIKERPEEKLHAAAYRK